MATTTNYGWTTPDDTALVKDGAAAIRTLGSSVDTTTKNLNPSTTLGDIEYRSSTANTNTRLGIGTTGQVLTVAGGVPSWATAASGGMTLLSTTTLSGVTTTISSINQTYTSLVGYMFGVNLAGGDNPMLRPNATDNTTNSSLFNVTNTYIDDFWYLTGTSAGVTGSNANNAWTFQIDNYASTTAFKPIQFYGTFAQNPTGNLRSIVGGGAFKSTTAVTSLGITTNSGTSYSAGTVLLYGVK